MFQCRIKKTALVTYFNCNRNNNNNVIFRVKMDRKEFNNKRTKTIHFI